MNLKDIYQAEGFKGLKLLAIAAKADPQYLRQCATGWHNKRPSPQLTARLIRADKRLTWEDMYDDEIEAAQSVAPIKRVHKSKKKTAK